VREYACNKIQGTVKSTYNMQDSGEIDGRLDRSADRLETLIGRMEATMRMECDCNLAGLRRENERLLSLLRAHPPPKPSMLPQRRLRLAAAQGWRCAICSEMLTEAFHADHRVPWSESFDDSDENIQIICYEDHMAKTSKEASCRRRQA
jgi:hypothetical protein